MTRIAKIRLHCAQKSGLDDRGSLPMLMLVMIATVAIGSVLLAIVISQTRSSRFIQTRTTSLEAAQSGIDAAIGRVRASVSAAGGGGSPSGDAQYLCFGSTSTYVLMSGSVSPPSTQSYAALVQYFLTDPNQPGATAMSCTSQGPFDSAAQKRVPKFAQVTSVGCQAGLLQTPSGSPPPMSVAAWCAAAPDGSSKGRAISTTFIVQSNNANFSGGLMRTLCAVPTPNGSQTPCSPLLSGSANASGTLPAAGLCIDATASKPDPNANPPVRARVQTCDKTFSSQQQWSFNSDSTISLSDTADPTKSSNGLCLDAPYTNGVHTQHQPIYLTTCQSPPTAEQQWTYEGGSQKNYLATLANGQEDDSNPNDPSSVSCLRDDDGNGKYTPISGGYLTLGPCGISDWATVPDPAVGSGPAGAALGFFVNYSQFGRCLDIFNNNLPSNDPATNLKYMIAYPCRATPPKDTQPHAQVFTFSSVPTNKASVTTTISTTAGGNQYCLTSPLADGLGGPDVGPYVTMTKCDGGSAQKWQIWGSTAQTGSYAQAYRIVDSTPGSGGLCLQPSTKSVDQNDSGISRIIVSACDTDPLQKWNADPNTDPSQLTHYGEN